MQQQDNHEYPFLYQRQTCHQRSEERFSRNAETDLVCRLLLEKKKKYRPQDTSKLEITLFRRRSYYYVFFNDSSSTYIYTLSLHDALPIFLILKSGVNHTSRGSISTSTLPSIKLRKCSSKIITSILSFISGRLAT